MTINLRPCAATCGPCPPTQSLTLMNLTTEEGCPGALSGSTGVYLNVGPIDCAWSCTSSVMTITVDRIRYFDGTGWNVVSGPFTPKSGFFWANIDPCGGCVTGTPYWDCGDPAADPPIQGTVWIQLDDLVGSATLAEQYEIVEVICDDTTVNVASDDPDPGEWLLNRQTVQQDYSRSISAMANCTETASAIAAQNLDLGPVLRARALFFKASTVPCIYEWSFLDNPGCPAAASCEQDRTESRSYTTHSSMSNTSCANVARNANTPDHGRVVAAGEVSRSAGDEFDGFGPAWTAAFSGEAYWRCGTVYVDGTLSFAWGGEPNEQIMDAIRSNPPSTDQDLTGKVYFHNCTKCWFRVILRAHITRGGSTGSPCAGAYYESLVFTLSASLRIEFGRDAA